jgi:glycerate kinase
LQGKGPYGVAVRAEEKNKMVIGIAGSVPLESGPGLQQYFDALIAINHDVADIKNSH